MFFFFLLVSTFLFIVSFNVMTIFRKNHGVNYSS